MRIGLKAADAYDMELQDWVDSLREQGRPTDPSAWDGYTSSVAAAPTAVNGAAEKPPVEIQPEFYK